MAALQYVDVTGYAAILFRRTYADLAKDGALLDRSREWLSGTDAVWNATDRRWRFPSGATVSFGHLDTDATRFEYQSAEYQFIGFDELTQFSEAQYTYMFSRLRRLKGANVPIRMRAASNPGGLGHNWVKQRFIVEGQVHGRAFVPAYARENSYLDRDEYHKALSELGGLERAQLEDGNWDASREGTLFKSEWFGTPWPVEVPDNAVTARVRYWDLAATEGGGDWTCGVRMARRSDGKFFVEEVERAQLSPSGVEDLLLRTAKRDGIGVGVFIEEEGGSSGKFAGAQFMRLLAGYNIHTRRPTGSKGQRALPVAAQVEKGNVLIVQGRWNQAFLDELLSFDPDAKPSPSIHDDQVDALSGAFQELAATITGATVRTWRGSSTF